MPRIKEIAPVKDKVHRYLYFASAHRLFIDSPHFQRLHQVLQNGAAYVAFPCNRNSRFAHSLGVGYLAGKGFIAAIRNAYKFNKDHLEDYIIMSAEIIESVSGDIEGDRGIDIGKAKKAWEKGYFSSEHFCDFDIKNYDIKYSDGDRVKSVNIPSRMIIDMLWFSVSLCALFHDAGHLPYSHSFEEAVELAATRKIKEFLNKIEDIEKNKSHRRKDEENINEFTVDIRNEFNKFIGNNEYIINDLIQFGLQNYKRASDNIDYYIKVLKKAIDENNININHSNFISELKIHEKRGMRILFDYVFHNIKNSFNKNDDFYHAISLIERICCCIMISNIEKGGSINKKYSLFQSLHYLYAGYIDADRMDYTLRDGIESGLDGKFDVDRIVNNFILFKRKYNSYEGHSYDKFYIGSFVRSISAIEEFYHRREYVWSVVVNHKCVMKAGAILKDIISRIIVLGMLSSENIGGNDYCIKNTKFFNFINMISDSRILSINVNKNTLGYRVISILPDDYESSLYLHDSSFISFLENVYSYLKKNKDGMGDGIDIDEYKCFIIEQLKIIEKMVGYFLSRDFNSVFHYGKNIKDIERIHAKIGDKVETECKPYDYEWGVEKEYCCAPYEVDSDKAFFDDCLNKVDLKKDYIYVWGNAKRKTPNKKKEGTHKVVIGHDGNLPIVKELWQVSKVIGRLFGISDVYRNDFIIRVGNAGEERSINADIEEKYISFLTCLCEKECDESQNHRVAGDAT